MKGVDSVIWKILFWYVLVDIMVLLWGIVYFTVRSYKFCKHHNCTNDYLEFIKNYQDSRPDVAWYIVILRVIVTPVWFPRKLMLELDIHEKAYLEQQKPE